eukprot:CAMPEP_0113608004 /NCGR_PEP_ID=MMETSP0017_2-20120614/3689_1 /TAXON_ID=2856 /ORGANISM="Cylindrotheca closterium" /LENGTH=431 /DNA_ID=CAMNT_0000516651 /DNA_START=71 /DNA_END=1366 /DNA_ORIENTATION=- /assembly_acc=CAM_ASM_000147
MTKKYPDKAPAEVSGRIQVAKDFYQHQVETSNLPRDMLDEIPRFAVDEVECGAILGTGGFCSVQEVKGFKLPDEVEKVREDHDDFDENEAEDAFEIGGDVEVDAGEVESRKFIAKHCYRSNGDARYAIKKLKPEIIADEVGFLNGIVDLTSEADFLSALEHPNIIKLRGFALKEDLFKPSYFLILDRLYDTLESRIPKWKAQESSAGAKKMFKSKSQKKLLKEVMEERMECVLDLASAIAYLHDKKVIHRDLKSENIGFDLRGDIKMFDLGLAKEIPKGAPPGAEFNFTAMCGTPRYMAPEVGLGKPYNEKSDVYSLSLLGWEILEMALPFAAIKSTQRFLHHVWKEDGPKMRPPISKKISKEVKGLLEKGWGGNHKQRPSASEFEGFMRKQCVAFNEEIGVNPGARRSTFIFVKGQGETVNENSSGRRRR